MSRRVIVNADDFGQTAGINRGIVEAHERGIVTSASLMVRWPAAAAAAACARAHPRLSVGLHVDLGELVYRDGAWTALYERVDRSNRHAVDVEIRRQIAMFHDLVGRGPTHLDSHQHVHRDEPVRSILDRVALELGVPLRHRSPHVAHDGRFYGQTDKGEPLPEHVSAVRLKELLRALPHGVVTEMGCHPGYADDLVSMYRDEREAEIRALCDPDVRRLVCEEAIELIAFTDLAAARRQSPHRTSVQTS